VRKLRKENQEWTARFRGEARSRATVLDMQRVIQQAAHEQEDVEQALRASERQAEEAEQRARKAIHDAVQWKALADRKSLTELQRSNIEDMLWKPKYDTVTGLWTTLTNDHDKLRNAFENLFEDYLDVTSKAARKYRSKITSSQLSATAEKFAGKKKKKTRQPVKKKNDKSGGKKKKGKFGPELVKSEVAERRKTFILTRKKKMSVHVADIKYDQSAHTSSSSVTSAEATPDWVNNTSKGEDHLLQILTCPSTQQSIVPHPWAKYKPGTAPAELRVAYVDYDRLLDLLSIVYEAAMSERFGGDIDPSETGQDEVGTFTGRMRLLSDVFREQLTLKYGQRSVVEGYLYGVAEAMVRYAPENLHVEFFGRMVGVVDPDLYTPRMGAMFLRLLRTVVEVPQALVLLMGEADDAGESSKSSGGSGGKVSGTKGKTGKGGGKGKGKGKKVESTQKEKETSAEGTEKKDKKKSGGDDGEDAPLVTIPLARALQAVETIFPTKPDYMLAWAKKELYPDLRERLVKCLRRLSIPSDKSMVLDVNLLLICCVDAWLEQHETDLYGLTKMFRERKIKEDKPLDYRVFADAARSCTHDAMPRVPDSILFPMFEQVLCTNDKHMDMCSRDGFAVVCCAWGVVPPPPPLEVEPGKIDKKKGAKGKKK